jgi:Rad3-related DNA helicase
MTDVTGDIRPMPSWFQSLRDHQEVAVEQIRDQFNSGAQAVFLDAPTGSGKTLIGEMTRRDVGGRSLYVCSDKALQDQFCRDFPYASLIQGRSNYPTELMGWTIRADECTASGPENPCLFCNGPKGCPYQRAKRQAMANELAVLNTAYLLTEGNGSKSSFAGANRRDLMILDEADVLEGALMGYVGFEVPTGVSRKMGMRFPKKGAHKKTLQTWLRSTGDAAALLAAKVDGTGDVKFQKQIVGFAMDCQRVAKELDIDLLMGNDGEEAGRWIRDYDTRTFRLRPVMVAPYGTRFLWRHAKRFLVMSATIISAQEMAESLGLRLPWAEVTVPMTFPVENRPIIVAPVASMTYKSMQDPATFDVMARAIVNVSKKHVGERVLVHCNSYRIAKELAGRCVTNDSYQHHAFVYESGAEKLAMLDQYLNDPNGMLFAASMARGVDLKGDACRVQVIAKVPFPSLADKQVSARMRLPGGDTWYKVLTVRERVQMTGRGVRSETDRAITYVLDEQFGRVWSQSKRLFPQWWRDAVDTTQRISWLLQ